MSAPATPTAVSRPPRRLARVLLWSGAALAALAIVTGFAGYWLLGTEPGARFGFERLGAFFPGEIKVEGIHGPLKGPLQVTKLHYKTDRVDLTVDSLALDWSLRAMAVHRLDVRRLDAQGVRVTLFERPRSTADTTELPDVDLPLDVMVKQGRIRDLHFTAAGAESARIIDEVRMESVAFRDTLKIGSFTMASRAFDLELHGAGLPRGRYAVDLDGRWTVRLPDRPDFTGFGHVIGSLDTLHVTQTVKTPFQGHLEAVAYHPLRDLFVEAQVDFKDLDPNRLDPGWLAARTDGHVRITGRLPGFTSEGRVQAATAQWGRLQATFSVAREIDAMRVHQLTVARPGQPTRLIARGVIGTQGDPRLDLSGNWRDLPLPLTGRSVLTSPDGTFRLNGTVQRYHLAANAGLRNERIPDSRWRMEGNGTPHSIDLARIDGQALGGSIAGHGRVTWGSPVHWQGTLAGRGLNPGVVAPSWPGNLAVDLQTQGVATPGGVRARFAVDRFEGTLRERPVAGHGTIDVTPDATSSPGVEVALGPNRATAEGAVGASWDLRWSIDAPDVSAVILDGGGKLRSSGTVTGPRRGARVEATVAADSLRWATGQVDSVSGTASLDFSRAGTSRLDVEARRAALGQRVIEHAALQGRGRIDDHQLTLDATSQQDSLKASARGGLAGRLWSGTLETFDLISRDLGRWGLEHQATLAASPASASLEGFCWRSAEQRTCVDFDWERAQPWNLSAELDSVRLALLKPVLPPALDLSGPAAGKVVARGSDGRVFGEARLDLGPGQIAYVRSGNQRGVTALRPSILNVRSDEDGLDVTAALALAVNDTVGGRLRLPHYRASGPIASQAMEGNLRARISDLGPIQGLVPDLAGTSGQFNADLAVEGTAGRPRWHGNAQLAQGAADVPRMNLAVRNITLSAVSDEGGHLRFEGSMQSGPGQLTMRGDATFSESGTPRATGSIQGQRVMVANTPDSKMLASPDLRMTLSGDSLMLTGNMEIPQADVMLRARRDQAIGPSPDVVFVDTLDVKPHRDRIKVGAEVRLALGNNIRVRGFGLDAKPAGAVVAIKSPDGPVLGSGELHVVSGRYNAYGRSLNIDHGRMIFAGGPITNPGLDVRASRRAQDGVVAGFEVQGTLQVPRLSVFSEPVMAERDALAYVLLGRKLDPSSQSQEAIVGEAANTLGIQGGSYVAETIAGKLGIQEASIESSSGFQDASLVLGTYLSPRLYVNYGVGIMDPSSTLRIQYFLNSKWTLQAETGSATSAQFLYTVEK